MDNKTLYMVGAGVLGFLAIRWYLRSGEEKSNASGRNSKDCISKRQYQCLTSDETKKQMIAILRNCGLSDSQIQSYFKSCKKVLESKLC